jgi:hypothetical protein
MMAVYSRAPPPLTFLEGFSFPRLCAIGGKKTSISEYTRSKLQLDAKKILAIDSH